MTLTTPHVKAALPFLCLGFAIVLCGWAFARSEKYHEESDLNFNQTYEVQWRTTQIREHLARLHGDLRLALATGRVGADLGRDVFFLDTNVGQLLNLEYVTKFLRDRDIELLHGLQANLRSQVDPLLRGETDFALALKSMPDLELEMAEVSGTAVAHAETLKTASQIAAATSRNRFLFAVALALAAVGYMIIHLRSALARRQDQHLRSFSSLYAHMTRSRVTALRLFLSYQDEENLKHPEMLGAAREAAQQLEAITNGLGTIAYTNKDTRKETLSTILESIRENCPAKLVISIDQDASEAMVPAQLGLIFDELVQNARAALNGRSDGLIRIMAQVQRRPLRNRRSLRVEVVDNGHGMSPDVLARAQTPFFSTRAGSHTGLGLTGCSQMVSALAGRFSIESAPSRGTSVTISVPV